MLATSTLSRRSQSPDFVVAPRRSALAWRPPPDGSRTAPRPRPVRARTPGYTHALGRLRVSSRQRHAPPPTMTLTYACHDTAACRSSSAATSTTARARSSADSSPTPGSLPEGKLEQVRANCDRNAKPFEYAFLLDALKDEQAQGITIDAARVFFKTEKRPYIIIDAPGHIEFLRNLITGAARAEAALLVIDAKEGVRENSRRHGYMMGMLGIRQLVVLVNKMDLVGYDADAFERIEREYRAFLEPIGVQPKGFIPVSGRDGDNIARHSDAMPWYRGPDRARGARRIPTAARPRPIGRFGWPCRTSTSSPGRATTAASSPGTIDSGRASVGDEVVFYPSGKKARIATFEAFNRRPRTTALAGEAIGFTLAEQIYVTRGEMAAIAERAAAASHDAHPRERLLARPPAAGTQPRLHPQARLGASCRCASRRFIACSTRRAWRSTRTKGQVDRHEVAECTLQDEPRNRLRPRGGPRDYQPLRHRRRLRDLGRRDRARRGLADALTEVRDRVLLRNFKWQPSQIAPQLRAERYHQRPTLVLVGRRRIRPAKATGEGARARAVRHGQRRVLPRHRERPVRRRRRPRARRGESRRAPAAARRGRESDARRRDDSRRDGGGSRARRRRGHPRRDRPGSTSRSCGSATRRRPTSRHDLLVPADRRAPRRSSRSSSCCRTRAFSSGRGDMSQFTETHTRSIAKALGWRLLGTIADVGDRASRSPRRWGLSLFVGGVEFVVQDRRCIGCTSGRGTACHTE